MPSEKDNYFELKQMYDAMRRKNEERIVQSSKRKLREIVEKRIRTTMIGALAEIERSEFGKMFGFGKTKLSDEERRWKMLWDELRTNILNQGNNQLRESMREIENFDARFKPYRTDFIIRRENENES
jgi:hypothetical protein